MKQSTPQKRRCTAKSKSTGTQCRRAPIAGGTVCRVHGGAAPQVKKAALERLRALQDPAISRLADVLSQASRITIQTKDGPESVPLIETNPTALVRAITAVLDRTGLGPTSKHEHSGPDGGPIATLDLSSLSDKELDQLERLVGKAAVEPADPGGES